MKKVVITLIAAVVIGIILTALTQDFRNRKPTSVRRVQEPAYAKPLAELENLPEGAIVFDVSYAGLPGDYYHSYWGFGRSSGDTDTPFIKAVRKKAGKVQVVKNSYFPDAMFSAVEILDDKPQAFYFDLDQNGKLSDNEKILPLTPKPEENSTGANFLTPDFDLKTQEGRTVPFRTLVRVEMRESKGKDPYADVMWSPACIYQGVASIDGEPARMTIFTNGFNGRFDQFGRAQYSLILEKDYDPEKGAYSQQTLSSLINYNNQFYSLQTYGSNEKGKEFKVALVKDTSPRGTVALDIKASDTLKTTLEYATINGKGDKTIYFNVSGGETTELPEGDYVLSRGGFRYGTETADEWRADFSKGPQFAITPDKETVITMGKPAIHVRAVDQNKRYNSDVKEQKNFAKGTKIYLEPRVKGMAGEVYGRFSKKDSDGGRWTDVAPHILILDPPGNEFASKTMEYGWGGSCGFSCESQKMQVGTYKVTMTLETGPLAGKLEDSIEMEIKEKE